MDQLYLIYPENAEAGALETLPFTKGLTLLSEKEYIRLSPTLASSSKICVTSEATLETILQNLADTSKIKAIEVMKDKYLFRKLLQKQFPALGYKEIGFDEIKDLSITSKKVIKPIKGCFGTAVKIIDNDSNLEDIATEIAQEIAVNSSVLSDSVLSKTEFILEDYIAGEEYAVDMFYDQNGVPHITNIYYHPLPKHEEYLHMIYYSSKLVFDQVYDKAISFFTKFNTTLHVKDMVLHAEFKYGNELIPIEINPMRFGGMGLGNMIYYGTKINPYACFIEGKGPNWKNIWEHYPNDNFVYFIAYNGTNINKNIEEPNIDALEQEFSCILNKTVFDYKKQLAFAVYSLKESNENIEKLLQLNFNNFFKAIPSKKNE